MRNYTVRVRAFGAGNDISLKHYHELNNALRAVTLAVRAGQVATIWAYDSGLR